MNWSILLRQHIWNHITSCSAILLVCHSLHTQSDMEDNLNLRRKIALTTLSIALFLKRVKLYFGIINGKI